MSETECDLLNQDSYDSNNDLCTILNNTLNNYNDNDYPNNNDYSNNNDYPNNNEFNKDSKNQENESKKTKREITNTFNTLDRQFKNNKKSFSLKLQKSI